MSAIPGIPEQGCARVCGNAPRAGEIETWLRELDFDVVTIEHSGAVEFFEAKLNTKETHA